jgi:WD40 repeat protein
LSETHHQVMTVKQLLKFPICLLLILFVVELSSAQKAELVVQTGHVDGVSSVAFSPDGMILASGSFDNTVKLWDVLTGTELCTLKGHSDLVFSLAFSPSGKTLASGGTDSTVKLWVVA